VPFFFLWQYFQPTQIKFNINNSQIKLKIIQNLEIAIWNLLKSSREWVNKYIIKMFDSQIVVPIKDHFNIVQANLLQAITDISVLPKHKSTNGPDPSSVIARSISINSEKSLACISVADSILSGSGKDELSSSTELISSDCIVLGIIGPPQYLHTNFFEYCPQ